MGTQPPAFGNAFARFGNITPPFCERRPLTGFRGGRTLSAPRPLALVPPFPAAPPFDLQAPPCRGGVGTARRGFWGIEGRSRRMVVVVVMGVRSLRSEVLHTRFAHPPAHTRPREGSPSRAREYHTPPTLSSFLNQTLPPHPPLFLLFLSSSNSTVPPHTPTPQPRHGISTPCAIRHRPNGNPLHPSSPLSWTASSPRWLTHLSPRLWKHPCRPPESPLALTSLLPPDSREESEPCLEPPNRAKRGQKAARCVSRQ